MEASTRKAIASHSVGCGVSVDIAGRRNGYSNNVTQPGA